MSYKYVVKKNLEFEIAVEKFKDSIEKVGLKVVAEVMPSQKIKKMLNIDIPPYKVLFVCHPRYIYEMMKMNYDVGTLVPCHAVVYVRNGETYVGVELSSEKLKPCDAKLAEYIKDAERKMIKAVNMV